MPSSQITRFDPVRRGNYVGEIFASRWHGGDMFHYVIQRHDSKDILHFGQELSEQRAREIVDDILESLVARSQSQSA